PAAEEPAAEEPAAEEPAAEEPAEEPAAIAEELKVDDLTVSIEAEAGAFPAGTVVSAEKVDFEDVQKAVDEAEDLAGEVLYAVDITFTCDGEELQPAEGKAVKVSFRADELKDVAEDATVVHIDAETEKAEKVETVEAEEEDEIAIEAEKFSVYAIIGDPVPVDESRITLIFHNPYQPGKPTPPADVMDTMYVKNQDCQETGAFAGGGEATPEKKLEMIVYDPGLGEAGLDSSYAETTFQGWEVYAASGSFTEVPEALQGVKTIADIRAWLINYSNDTGFKEGDTLELRPVLAKIYHVVYFDLHYDERPDVVIGSDSVAVVVDQAGSHTDYTVSWPYYVEDPDRWNFSGWEVKSGGSNIDGWEAGTIYPNDETISIKGDIELWPKLKQGQWLIFDEVRPGAPYVAPRFLGDGEETEPPEAEDMQLLGYEFQYWAYEDGSKYNGEAIDGKTTVHAVWKAVEEAAFTVIIWKQNLDEDNLQPDDSYSYEKSIRLWGTVGDTVDDSTLWIEDDNNDADYLVINGVDPNGDPVDENYKVVHTGRTGEVHNYDNEEFVGYYCDRIDQGKVIQPEGNTIVNVYYDRLIYNVKIYHAGITTGDNPSYLIFTTRQNNNTLTLGGMNHPDATIAGDDYDGPKPDDTDYFTETSTFTAYNTNTNYHGVYKLISAPYGADITSQWPQYPEFPSETVGNTSYGFVSWYMQNDAAGYRGQGSGLDTFKGTINVMDEKILGDVTSTAADDNYLIGRYDARTLNIYTYQIWLEVLYDADGNPIDDDGDPIPANRLKTLGDMTLYLKEEIQANSNADPDGTQAPNYIGFQHIEGEDIKPALQNNRATIQFHYSRIQNTIIYRDGGYFNPYGENGVYLIDYPATGADNTTKHTNIPFGTDLSSYNKGEENYFDEYPSSHEGFVFEGWYIDDTCTVEYTFDRMQENNITVYAKFRQKQYRVYLDPVVNSPEPLDYGVDDPDMCILATDGEFIDLPTPQRNDYKMMGWYSDPAYDPSTWFDDEAYKINSTTVTEPYDVDVDKTHEYNKYGQLVDESAAYNEDKQEKRFWVTNKLKLYAKWSSTMVGAFGIKVVYDAWEGEETGDLQGSFPGGERYWEGDQNLYVDRAGVAAQYASTPPTGKVFLYWVLQDYDDDAGKFVDTDETVYPGDSFLVKVEYAHKVETAESTPDDPKYDYTVHLRAEYADPETWRPTHITWYTVDNEAVLEDMYPFEDDPFVAANHPYICAFQDKLHINEPMDIPAVPTEEQFPDNLMPGGYEAYDFVGWGKGHAVSTRAVDNYVLPEEPWLYWDGEAYHVGSLDGTVVTQVAADEFDPYEDLFGMWEPKWEGDTFYVVYDSDPDNIYAFNVDDFDSDNDEYLDVVHGKKATQVDDDEYEYNDAVDVTEATPLKNVYDECLYGGYIIASLDENNQLVVDPVNTAGYGEQSGADPGYAISPQKDVVYYVRDVNVNYLSNFYKYTYVNFKKRLTGLWVMSVVDTTYYYKTGFVTWDAAYDGDKDGNLDTNGISVDPDLFESGIYHSLTVHTYNHGTAVAVANVKPNTIYSDADNDNNYVSFFKVEDLYGETTFVKTISASGERRAAKFCIAPYWVTLDGVCVLGKNYRTIMIHPDTSTPASRLDDQALTGELLGIQLTLLNDYYFSTTNTGGGS
ncbi:MAG: InlB B-repeat-containing protein, partial [Oscillospiraceae bacterium]|nr:InlB B-repeat-containing protein [Oscillospiraceae bacterium]